MSSQGINGPKTDLTEHREWLQNILNNSTDDKNLSADESNLSPNNNTSQIKSQKQRWDNLYELNKLKQESRNMMAQTQKVKAEQEFEACTFKPYILETSQKMMEKFKNKDLVERNKEWEHNKQMKIKSIAESKEGREKVHCTFQPQLKSSSKQIKSSQNLPSTKGADKFIERQQKAREEKKRVEEILNGNYRLKVKMDKSHEDPSGYTHKFVKSIEPGFDEVFRGLKSKTFSECTLTLHDLLNSFDINI